MQIQKFCENAIIVGQLSDLGRFAVECYHVEICDFTMLVSLLKCYQTGDYFCIKKDTEKFLNL